MPIKDYGVWVATPTVFSAERTGKSPHGNLTFDDGTGKFGSTEANINVKSITGDTRLVYWDNASFTNAFTDNLAQLSKGFTSLVDSDTGSDGVRLDLLRGGLETLTDGTVLSTNVPGANNDIVDELTDVFNRAIDDNATIYLWGQQYIDSSKSAGIHDIHMNQGDSGSFSKDNGTWQDGSFILQFADGHYEAVFIAFAEQITQTDNGGQPISGAPSFAELLNAPPETSSGKKSDFNDHSEAHSHHSRHKRRAKHVKRHGHQFEESPVKWTSKSNDKRPSHVVIHDPDHRRNMSGWSLVDHQGKEHKIGDKEAHSIQNGDEVEFPEMSLNKSGGTVYLKDNHGKTVSDMVYSKFR